jgi:chaperonin GroEL
MTKKITFSNDARNNLAAGVDKLANAVTATLGPAGRNVIIEQDMGNPVSTKDGVTVAKSLITTLTGYLKKQKNTTKK